MADEHASLSGLTEGEAQEYHKYFIQGFMIFTAVAVVAHILVWMWRPWIPGDEGYVVVSKATETVSALLPMIA